MAQFSFNCRKLRFHCTRRPTGAPLLFLTFPAFSGMVEYKAKMKQTSHITRSYNNNNTKANVPQQVKGGGERSTQRRTATLTQAAQASHHHEGSSGEQDKTTAAWCCHVSIIGSWEVRTCTLAAWYLYWALAQIPRKPELFCADYRKSPLFTQGGFVGLFPWWLFPCGVGLTSYLAPNYFKIRNQSPSVACGQPNLA